MRTLAPAQRRAFRAKAHSLHPVVAIGQHGLTPAVLHEIDVNLLAHELIKIRVFADDRDERDALLLRICGDLDAAPVQHLGKVLTIWRPAPPPEPEPVAPKDAKRDRKSARKADERAGKKPAGPRETTAGAGAKRASRNPAAPRATAPTGAKRAPRRGPSVILGAEPIRRKPRGAAKKVKAPSRRPPPPHGKSASSRVGASGARRRRKARA